MPKFAANLTMLFNEVPFMERFAAAKAAGFTAVEYLFPYAYDKQELAQALRANGLQQVLHNLPPGNWDAGERGIACHPDRITAFLTRGGDLGSNFFQSHLVQPGFGGMAMHMSAPVGAGSLASVAVELGRRSQTPARMRVSARFAMALFSGASCASWKQRRRIAWLQAVHVFRGSRPIIDSHVQPS